MASERFRAFSFVDRITRCTDRHIEGEYTVPAGASRFPASLMAEAVGQLAAWSAMAELDFAWRPVAGLAGATVYHRIVEPGQTLQLEADIARCDAEAVAYGGRAYIDGECALELVDCVGPMLPMTDFDEPEAVRADFETLRTQGVPAGRFKGVPAPRIETVEHVAGRRMTGRLHVPQLDEASYFADHFPRRPVYPGTLLLDAIAGLAVQVAGEAMPASAGMLMPRRVSNVKIRSFTLPGTTLDLDIELQESDGEQARLKVGARNDGKMVAAARIEVGLRGSALP
jgi:3-hydroxymyristoyl/3-hydroxydecanoyl-(acyl carrier protein) dehydratase